MLFGKGLRTLALTTAVAVAAAMALIFFYAPIEADQGFVQKIFYIHVPLATVALGGWIAGVVFAITGPRLAGRGERPGPATASRQRRGKNAGGSFTSRMEDRFRRRFEE